jgi:hypothetical protein
MLPWCFVTWLATRGTPGSLWPGHVSLRDCPGFAIQKLELSCTIWQHSSHMYPESYRQSYWKFTIQNMIGTLQDKGISLCMTQHARRQKIKINEPASTQLRPRLHETGSPERSQTGTISFRHSIIYNRCLHETGTKITPTGLESLRLLDWADWLQIGMNSDRDECKHKYISDRSRMLPWHWNNTC